GALKLDRLIANQTEERVSTNEPKRQTMAQMRAGDVQPDLRMHGCELDYLRQLQICFLLNRMNQSRDYNRLAFHYNPADDYSLSPHVLIGTVNEVCPYCKALKSKGEEKRMCYAAGKIKLPQLEGPPEPLKTLLAGYATESEHFHLKSGNTTCASK
ncbi:unnamed protein product, partial [Onchocerca ochengi]